MSVYPGVVSSNVHLPPLPPPLPFPWTRLQITWYSPDGVEWDLSRPDSGVFITRDGLRGLRWPTFELGTSTSGARPGRRRRTARVAERPAELPIYVFHGDGSQAFADRWEAFQNSWDPLRPGRLEVVSPLGRRSLYLYFDADSEETWTYDPAFMGYARTTIQATAEDRPYWEGDPIPGRWVNGDPEPFFRDGRLFIANTAGIANATMRNPGNVSAWPVWTITNTEPAQGITVTVTVNGGTITTPAIGAGHSLTLDTDTGRARLDDGTNYAGLLDPYNPRPVPPGAAVPLGLVMSGFGTVESSLIPRYWRAL